MTKKGEGRRGGKTERGNMEKEKEMAGEGTERKERGRYNVNSEARRTRVWRSEG